MQGHLVFAVVILLFCQLVSSKADKPMLGLNLADKVEWKQSSSGEAGAAMTKTRPRRSDDTSICELLLQQHSQRIDQLTADMYLLKAKQGRCEVNVAFHARRTADRFAVQGGSTIVYDSVTINIGNGYDDHTGVFTAPVAGTYAIHSSCMVSVAMADVRLGVDVMADDVTIAQCWSQSETGGQSELASSEVTVHLKAGSRVLTKSIESTSVRGGFWTTFGGFLIRADAI